MISYVEKSPPGVDSIDVNSKKKLLKLMLEVKEDLFHNSSFSNWNYIKKFIFNFNKRWRSSKILFNEHAFMLNMDSGLFFQEILEFEVDKYQGK